MASLYKIIVFSICLQFGSIFGLEPDYFVIFHVDAPHLDYSSCKQMLQGIAVRRNFGHAWIYLEGLLDGRRVYVEGGHSGERGLLQPRYFDTIMNAIERRDQNPIKHLWETQHDGFFQEGSGGHEPTFSLKVKLTENQFKNILEAIKPENYSYVDYALVHHQCCTFVALIGKIVGLRLDEKIKVNIPREIYFRGAHMHLWDDPIYSEVLLSTPDTLEKALKGLGAKKKN